MVLRLRFLRQGFVVYISYRRRRRPGRDFSLVLLQTEARESHKPFVSAICLRFAAQRDQIAPRTSRCVMWRAAIFNFNGLNPERRVVAAGGFVCPSDLSCVCHRRRLLRMKNAVSSLRREISSKCTDKKSIYTFTRTCTSCFTFFVCCSERGRVFYLLRHYLPRVYV